MSLDSFADTSEADRRRFGEVALAVLKFGLAGCVIVLTGTLGSVIWKIVSG